jgi:hypothetical protein
MWMLGELEKFDEFVGTHHRIMPSRRIAEIKLAKLIAEQPVFIAEDRLGNRVGFIAGMLAEHYFNPDIIVLTELLWWVDPAHRGGRAAKVLFDAYMDLGQKTAQWIVMTLEEKSPINPGWLIRRGFVPQEHNYLLEVKA